MRQEYGAERIRHDDVSHQAPLYADENVVPSECEKCDRVVYKNIRSIGERGHCSTCMEQTLSIPREFIGGFDVIGVEGDVDMTVRNYAKAGAIFDE